MPVISMFYGILIFMYFEDNRRHKMPHIHVHYQEQEAIVDIPGGRVLEGSLPPAKLRLVQAWVEIHREELMANWALAKEGQAVCKIEPLR